VKYLKTYESYWTEQEYIADVMHGLTSYNIKPLDLTRVLTEYEDEILDYRDSGKHPNLFVDKIAKELDLDKGGFLRQTRTARGVWKSNYL
jgi:hypothetical protein